VCLCKLDSERRKHASEFRIVEPIPEFLADFN